MKTREAPKFRPFNDGDWMGYSGAESFSEDAPPLIAEVAVDGHEADLIVDKVGVSAHWMVDDKSFYACIDLPEAFRVLAFLAPKVTTRQLREQGFRVEEC